MPEGLSFRVARQKQHDMLFLSWRNCPKQGVSEARFVLARDTTMRRWWAGVGEYRRHDVGISVAIILGDCHGIFQIPRNDRNKKSRTIPHPRKRGSPLYTRRPKKAYFFRLPVYGLVDNGCMAGRPTKDALVRRQFRLGLCPKMKNHPLCGWIFIVRRYKSSHF